MNVRQLQSKINVLRGELLKKEHAQWIRENKKYVGTYWKYRNNYSCPDGESDYWWAYRKLTSIDMDGGHFLATSFQTDKNGWHRIEVDEYCSGPSSWEPCSKAEYERAFKTLADKIAGLQS